jgi:hypothetical protein
MQCGLCRCSQMTCRLQAPGGTASPNPGQTAPPHPRAVPYPGADHGIPQEEIDVAFATGQTFLDKDKEFKAQYPFNPDSYLGWRGPDELETVTGAFGPALGPTAAASLCPSGTPPLCPLS